MDTVMTELPWNLTDIETYCEMSQMVNEINLEVRMEKEDGWTPEAPC